MSGYLRSGRRRYRLTCIDCRSSLAVILGLDRPQHTPATHLVKYRFSGLRLRVCAEHARKRTTRGTRERRFYLETAEPGSAVWFDWATRVDAYRFRSLP